MSLYFKDSKIKKIYHGTTKVKKIYFGNTKVWSSGSEVTYFSEDGSTVLGTADVDEGLDVLHPTMATPTKDNHTFVGWTDYGGTERFETKVADGEPISLYALFVPNSVVAFEADITHLNYNTYRNWEYTFTITTNNSTYISGNLLATCQCNEWNPERNEVSFTLNKKYYGTATALFNSRHGYLDVSELDWGGGYIDSEAFSTRFKGEKTLLLGGGPHTIVAMIQSFDDYKDRALVYAKRITLSNPDAWELPQPIQ